MRLPQIQITTTDIKMNYNIKPPVQHIKQPQAELSIEQPAAILEINTTNPVFKTDMTQFLRDLGMRPTGEIVSEFAQKGKQGAMEGISRRVSEGRQMMLGAGKGQGAGTIKSIAIQNHGPKREGPYNVKFIPSYQSIKVDITPGTTEVSIQQQQVKHNAKVNKPVMNLERGSVDGTMVQRPDVHIDVQI